MENKIISNNSLSGIVHDLKAPITSIMGFVELLKEGNYDKKVTMEFYDIILSESQKLLDLVEEILQFNKKNELDYNVSSLNVQVNKYVKELTPLAHKRHIEIFVSCPPDDVYVSIPEDRISRILVNIIENAIKYNKEYGKIFINIDTSNSVVFIKVRDTGCGIPQSEMDRVFDKYYRSANAENSSVSGTGLGLSIVKEIVDAYKGKITVNSSVDKYTEFVVQLPLASQPPVKTDSVHK